MVEEETPIDQHRWEVARKAMFGCDDSQYVCAKCMAKLSVQNDQTIAQAMEGQKIRPNCAEHLVADMDAF